MRAITLGTVFLLVGCATLQPSADVPVTATGSLHSPEAAARGDLEAQIAAWNRGDLEAAFRAYWNSPDTTWVSKSGVQRGFAAFAQGMRTDFADPAAMGTYSAEVLDARSLSPSAAVIVSRWQIMKSGRRIMGGTSTQVWREIEGSWRAVLEHAS
jgi:uncharacterized protein (TIGR02246 family)